MVNYWIDRAIEPIEKELILVKNAKETKHWYDRMPSLVPVMFTAQQKLKRPEDFGPKVGLAHHLRLTKFGIEAVIKAPRKYHRLPFYVIHDKVNQPETPFWVVFYKV
jgi:hypothetical protein